MRLRAKAPAKVNLTLRVLGRRADGFHALDSLVAFAGCAADALTLEIGPDLALDLVDGPFAAAAGEPRDNLVLRAARAAAERIEGLRLGTFGLTKRIPVAAGLGGGSADAGSALRLIAQANDLASDDPRLVEAAAATGSDVPACLLSRAARMTGRGETVEPVEMAPLAAVLANPMKGLSTAEVFRSVALEPENAFVSERARTFTSPRRGEVDAAQAAAGEGASGWPDWARPPHPALRADPRSGQGQALSPQGRGGEPRSIANVLLQDIIITGRNDLEPPARALMPEIGHGVDAVAATDGCRLARMSGSGATVFGLYDDQRAARRAARALRLALPGWWIRPTMLR